MISQADMIDNKLPKKKKKKGILLKKRNIAKYQNCPMWLVEMENRRFQ